MFTGIVEELGAVRSADRGRLILTSRVVADGAAVGASIAVNGVCLTLVDRDGIVCTFDLAGETLKRTTLGSLERGSRVNLERPATLASRLGGHLVQGHVDGIATVASVVPDAAGGARLTVTVPARLVHLIVEQGSVTLDGVSLTVAALEDDRIEIALVPHTLAVTTLGTLRAGDRVNLEVDMVAKYVERLLAGSRR